MLLGHHPFHLQFPFPSPPPPANIGLPRGTQCFILALFRFDKIKVSPGVRVIIVVS